MEIVPPLRTNWPPPYRPRPSPSSTALPSLWSVLHEPRFIRLAFLVLVLPPYILSLVLLAQLFSQPRAAPAARPVPPLVGRLVHASPAPRHLAIRRTFPTLTGLRP